MPCHPACKFVERTLADFFEPSCGDFARGEYVRRERGQMSLALHLQRLAHNRLVVFHEAEQECLTSCLQGTPAFIFRVSENPIVDGFFDLLDGEQHGPTGYLF